MQYNFIFVGILVTHHVAEVFFSLKTSTSTTPILAMQCLTDGEPIEKIIKEKALILFEKLI